MKFDIYFLIRGTARTLEVPNNSNPVEAMNLAGLLVSLGTKLPHGRMLGGEFETIGLRVVPRLEDDGA